jgi:farnesyl-diphosphate farnesyltransferase
MSPEEQFQDAILPSVSRTFALTIPQLPESIRGAVTNAYLLCRIADTIEDESALSDDERQHFHEAFIAVVEGRGEAKRFADTLAARLTGATSEEERELVRGTEKVVAYTLSLPERLREPLVHCVAIMSRGMGRFAHAAEGQGVANLAEFERYCYYVAGVVGEMLTELFCTIDDEISRQRGKLMRLAVSFGQGLQMVNILKDIWEDHRRGYCWLPRDVFEAYGVDVANKREDETPEGFARGMDEMVGIAHGHLQHALDYTESLPRRHVGVRRFCLWAIGLAVLTLRKVHRKPHFRHGSEVKVSRRTVRWTVVATSLASRSNTSLRVLFKLAARGLPGNGRISSQGLPSEWALKDRPTAKSA